MSRQVIEQVRIFFNKTVLPTVAFPAFAVILLVKLF